VVFTLGSILEGPVLLTAQVAIRALLIEFIYLSIYLSRILSYSVIPYILQFASCTLYRNFLLLDPSDTATVDEYLSKEENFRRECGEDSVVPSSSAPRGRGQDDSGVFCGASTENKANTPAKVQTPGEMDLGEGNWQGDGDEAMMWDDPHM
jgi:hypothetical protein